MPHRIINLNAGPYYDSDEFENVKNWVIIERGMRSASKPLEWLKPIYDRVPVFLVDEPLMDEIYPPWKWAVVSENCLKERLEKYEFQRKIPAREDQFEEMESPEIQDEESEDEYDLSDLEEGEWPSDLWGAWRHCTSRKYRKYYAPAAGVYLSQLSQSQLEAIQSHKGGGGQRTVFDENVLENTFLNLSRIFICPDRIKRTVKNRRGKNTWNEFRLLFAKVFFHELAHALMDRMKNEDRSRRYRLPWGRVIEESLANAIAFDALHGAKGINDLHGYIERQPLPYQGYHYFLNLKRSIGDAAHCLTFSKNFQVSERNNDCLLAERRILYGLAEAWESNIPFNQFTNPFCFSDSGTHGQRLSQFLKQDGAGYAKTYWKVLGAEIIAHVYDVRWRK